MTRRICPQCKGISKHDVCYPCFFSKRKGGAPAYSADQIRAKLRTKQETGPTYQKWFRLLKLLEAAK